MRKGIWLLVTASVTLPVAACGGGDELKSGGSSSSGDKSKPSLTVGSANFPENVLLGEIYGVAQKAEELSTDPRLLALAMLIGVLTSIIAAIIPARNAARVDPVQALQKGRLVREVGTHRIGQLAGRTRTGQHGQVAPGALEGSVGV